MAAHRYWRLFVESTNSTTNYVEVAELQLRTIAGTPESPTGGTDIRSSVYTTGATYQASNAFDGNASTRWRSNSNANEWIGYDYGAGNEKDIVEIAVQAFTATAQTPKSIALQYSDDGLIWKPAAWFLEQTGWTSGQVRVLGVPVPPVAQRATQVVVQVVDLTNQPNRLTQLVAQVIALPFQPARVTQVPVQVANHPTPVPQPLPLMPEVPVTELWNYATVVNVAEFSKEQRSCLRPDPKVGIEFTVFLENDADRRRAYQLVSKLIKQSFYHPLYVFSAKMALAAPAGSTKLYFNPAKTDIRVGEPLAFVDTTTNEIKFSSTLDTATLAPRIISVASVDVDGARFAEPLMFDIQAHWQVCPVALVRMSPSTGLAMTSVSGDMDLKLETSAPRQLVRPSGAVTLPQIEGFIILDKRPLANDEVSENFDFNVKWLDNDINKVEPRTMWQSPFISGKREFLMRRSEIDFWRSFADSVRGKWKPFVFSTFRDDLPLAAVPALSATRLVSSNIHFFEFWRSFTYRYIRIERAIGSIYRRINEVTMNYDSGGAPVSINIDLSSSIGGAAGSNIISKVSFANICRLNNDTIQLVHGEIDSVISMEIRTVDE